MDDDGSDDDVVAALAGPRALWESACDAGKNLSQGKLPDASSAAMAELADEAHYVNPHWPEPVRAAHSVIRVGLFAVNGLFADERGVRVLGA